MSDLDGISSRVLSDYAIQNPAIMTSTSAGNNESVHWEILDMRAQLIDGGSELDGKRIAPRKRTISIDELDDM